MIEKTKEATANLPWVEKYRPNTLDDLISKEDIVKTINKFIEENQLPHLLFYGPPGTGKTSTILACAKQLYGPSQFSSMVLELNASDDRGIGINALRRIIEKFTDNVRFCIICNYLGKIIPALQSRCTRFRFAPLVADEIIPRLNYIIEQEKIEVTEDGKKAVITLGQGDMRRILNILQSTAISSPKVTEEAVYTCVGHPLQSDIMNILKSLLNDDISSTYKKVKKLQVMKGLALADIITELHGLVHRIEFPARVICDLFIALADIEYRLETGASESIQLSGLLAAFQHARIKAATLAQPEEK
ncbi:UNVERIFIED_CONTAM: hypothetical protein PYX00_001887 [Menopon gallinae]|uniref:Activator 1 subunit 5 n=1 Tax=Menopon gallinae TaxID=328185 RepID=A0AAW2IFS3_9NEOP